MTIKVAIIGIGNCASSLVQGCTYYKNIDGDRFYPGLMRSHIGFYAPDDIEFVAGFDVDSRKVGLSIADAIFAGENCTKRIVDRVERAYGPVFMAPKLDGLGKHYSKRLKGRVLENQVIESHGREEIVKILRDSQADIIVNYLPVGSEDASRWWAETALQANCAFINSIPVFIASDPEWMRRFNEAGLPLLGDDIKSQFGATILHRQIAKLLHLRGIKVKHTFQLNYGGNMDFFNMLDNDRLQSKKKSKTGSVESELPYEIGDENIHVGPSDHVAFLGDQKWCDIRVEGEAFGGVPLELELRLKVWDSPNSAGVVVDAIRCAQLALDVDKGDRLPIHVPSSCFFKTPPFQVTDQDAEAELNDWISEMEELSMREKVSKPIPDGAFPKGGKL